MRKMKHFCTFDLKGVDKRPQQLGSFVLFWIFGFLKGIFAFACVDTQNSSSSTGKCGLLAGLPGIFTSPSDAPSLRISPQNAHPQEYPKFPLRLIFVVIRGVRPYPIKTLLRSKTRASCERVLIACASDVDDDVDDDVDGIRRQGDPQAVIHISTAHIPRRLSTYPQAVIHRRIMPSLSMCQKCTYCLGLSLARIMRVCVDRFLRP